MPQPVAALNIRDTAESAGISRSTLYALIAQGRGPRVLKINRRSLVLIEERDRWLRNLVEEAAITHQTYPERG
jgi:predicted DNA-binding transcriptional regulator AlpA